MGYFLYFVIFLLFLIQNIVTLIMTVKELMEIIDKLPQDMRCFNLHDGEPRSAVNLVYESKGGYIIFTDYNERCLSDNSKPINANIDMKPPIGYNESVDEIKF